MKKLERERTFYRPDGTLKGQAGAKVLEFSPIQYRNTITLDVNGEYICSSGAKYTYVYDIPFTEKRIEIDEDGNAEIIPYSKILIQYGDGSFSYLKASHKRQYKFVIKKGGPTKAVYLEDVSFI